MINGAQKVKVCCIKSVEEANIAIRAGASALGFVSHMPSGPGVIPETLIAEIVKNIPPAISTFLLTSQQDPAAIIEQQKFCRVNTIQLCDSLPLKDYRKLRIEMPGIAIVQVIHIIDHIAIDEARTICDEVDAILLDSGNPALEIKKLGGTGKVHNWDISKRIVEEVKKPVFLAGGLNVNNISDAIEHVKPYGIDLCSGVRRNDKLDENMLSSFIAAVWGRHPSMNTKIEPLGLI